jgi:large subunit ribosomal protein L31e
VKFYRSFKKRAPKAIKVIREFVAKAMGTKDVRVAPELNTAVWNRGVKSVPHRIRIRVSRKRNDEEDAKEKLYSLVQHVPVTSFKGMYLPSGVSDLHGRRTKSDFINLENRTGLF